MPFGEWRIILRQLPRTANFFAMELARRNAPLPRKAGKNQKGGIVHGIFVSSRAI